MKSIAINHGTVIDPGNRIAASLNLFIEGGKVMNVSTEPFFGDRVIDAGGMIVSPGFVDIHMHEDEETDPESSNSHTFEALLKMGVTTAIGGNCGAGPESFPEYMEKLEDKGTLLNIGLLIPHASLRASVGGHDRYECLKKEQTDEMATRVAGFMEQGALGISYGIRYIPGINEYELMKTAEPVIKNHGLISAHIRDDAKGVIGAAKEFLRIAEFHPEANLLVSHIGSMAAYGQMEAFLSLVDEYKGKGCNVASDCYPYAAFSTGLGATTYDPGFLERYGIGYEKVVIADGPHRGQPLTKELYDELRKSAPETMTVAHVMREEEVNLALSHPGVMVASDGSIKKRQGHPRAAGTFPRFLRKVLDGDLPVSLPEAIGKITAQPCEKAGIPKGHLGIGSDGDIVIFDPKEIRDRATFDEPTETPGGIHYVIVNGEIAVEQGEIKSRNAGRLIKKENL